MAVSRGLGIVLFFLIPMIIDIRRSMTIGAGSGFKPIFEPFFFELGFAFRAKSFLDVSTFKHPPKHEDNPSYYASNENTKCWFHDKSINEKMLISRPRTHFLAHINAMKKVISASLRRWGFFQNFIKILISAHIIFLRYFP